METRITVTPEVLEEAASRFEHGAQRAEEVIAALKAATQDLDGDWCGVSAGSFKSTWARILVMIAGDPVRARHVARLFREIAANFRNAEQRGVAVTVKTPVAPPKNPALGVLPSSVRGWREATALEGDGDSESFPRQLA